MHDPQTETLVPFAKKHAGTHLFAVARRVGVLAGALTVASFLFPILAPILLIFAVVAWITTGALWAEANETHSGVTDVRSSTVWQEVNRLSPFSENPTTAESEFFQRIESIYERDPHGKILPLSQAIQLTLAWKQQQDRLEILARQIEQMHTARVALLDNQKLLRDLNDEDANLERTLVRLNEDLAPLERNRDALHASCTRLESLLREVDTFIRRRELHSEVNKIASSLPPRKTAEPFDLPADHLDTERQITREIETYLQLEIATEAQMRDL